MPPVALGIEISQVKTILPAESYGRNRARDLAGDESLATARTLMVEEDTVGGVDAIRFPVVHRDPIAIELGNGVGAARVKGGVFILRYGLHFTVQFARGSLVEAGLARQPKDSDGLKQPERTHAVRIPSVFRRLEAHLHMALGTQIVDLVRLCLLQYADQVRRVRQIAVVQEEAGIRHVRVGVEVVHPLRVEGG
jgi:hypothetical protein